MSRSGTHPIIALMKTLLQVMCVPLLSTARSLHHFPAVVNYRTPCGVAGATTTLKKNSLVVLREKSRGPAREFLFLDGGWSRIRGAHQSNIASVPPRWNGV